MDTEGRVAQFCNFQSKVLSFRNKMWNFAGNLVSSLLKAPTTTVVTCLRFYERRRVLRRFGYAPHYHCKGLLPRIKDEKPIPMKSTPMEAKPDPWRPAAAVFGENNYIDILGDDRINPTQLMQSVPTWLRKFRGNEMQMLVRKRNAKAHWQWNKPLRYHRLQKRIEYLYKRLNYKTAPPSPRYPWNS